MESPSQHQSEPNITTQLESVSPNKIITSRCRRKKTNDTDISIIDVKTELMSMLKNLQDNQERQFNSLNSKIDELKNQNLELKESVEFFSAKYDEFTQKIEQLERDKKEDRNNIKLLEGRVEFLEQKLRTSCLEIKNVPLNSTETKEDLINVVMNLSKVIKSPLQATDLREIYRLPSVKQHPIVVEFNSSIIRERVLRMTKQFNREHSNEKLNTKHIQMSNIPIQNIYVSESLTSKSRRLLFLARGFAARNKFKFCWTSGGKVFLRRDEGQSHISINTEQDLKNLHIDED